MFIAHSSVSNKSLCAEQRVLLHTSHSNFPLLEICTNFVNSHKCHISHIFSCIYASPVPLYKFTTNKQQSYFSSSSSKPVGHLRISISIGAQIAYQRVSSCSRLRSGAYLKCAMYLHGNTGWMTTQVRGGSLTKPPRFPMPPCSTANARIPDQEMNIGVNRTAQ